MTGIEAQQRAAVIAEARSWIGTPWRHGAAVKGEAVDCAMLLVSVFTAAGIIEPFDPRPYPRTWFLHQNEERFLGWLEKLGAREIAPDLAQPGDVLVYRYGRCFSHGAVLVARQLIVHAFVRNRTTVLTETFDGDLVARPCRAFDVWATRRGLTL
jgi:NlpC/P60 family putative phage cell wall peptidase